MKNFLNTYSVFRKNIKDKIDQYTVSSCECFVGPCKYLTEIAYKRKKTGIIEVCIQVVDELLPGSRQIKSRQFRFLNAYMQPVAECTIDCINGEVVSLADLEEESNA